MGNRRGANRIKATRDATFIEKNPQGVPVNRTEAIAWLGGAANNNEDCYLAPRRYASPRRQHSAIIYQHDLKLPLKSMSVSGARGISRPWILERHGRGTLCLWSGYSLWAWT